MTTLSLPLLGADGNQKRHGDTPADFAEPERPVWCARQRLVTGRAVVAVAGEPQRRLRKASLNPSTHVAKQGRSCTRVAAVHVARSLHVDLDVCRRFWALPSGCATS
jgi:hypothetical protein